MWLFQRLLMLCLLCSIACAPSRKQIFYPPQSSHQPSVGSHSTQTQPLPPNSAASKIPPLPPVTPEDEQFGHEILSKLSEKYTLDFNHPRRSEVDDIVKKITHAIGGSNQPWHVNVFADNKVKNAAATRGNNIFIWTGMIDATDNENELAAVLSHEVAHILARHTEPSSGESTREFIVGLGAMIAGTAVGVLTNGAIGSDIASQLAASLTKEVGAGILIYPYTRDKEYEADEIGLYLMHAAGYHPKHAIDFWKRAANDPDFSASIPFFSTHPPAADRLDKLAQLIPQVLQSTVSTPSITPDPKKPDAQNQSKVPVVTSTQNTQKTPPQVLSPSDSFDIRK